MPVTTPVEPIEAAPLDQSRILDLYNRGLFVQAYEAGRTAGPLAAWPGTAGRILAGRLAWHLGAPRLGRTLYLLAWRNNPCDAQAQYYYAATLNERRGPLAAWKVLKRWGDGLDGDADQRAAWFALRASTAAWLRDFDAAEQWLARADEANPASAWVCVERARVLECEDRYPEALAAARLALERRPWYTPAVAGAAHLLQLLDRDGDALDLLTEAVQRVESGPLAAQLAMLQIELGRHADARQSLERFAVLSPLLERDGRRWLDASRSDAAYYDGDFARAAELARQAGGPFYQAVAERLTAGGDARRVLLPVRFVRQHHATCAPATLAALSAFWSMPADHLEVAEAICYDGTSEHSERRWAEQHGWTVREFTVTRETAVALLDRGIPFALTTRETGMGHLQAVIGYDERRGVLLIRDPFQRLFREFLADEMVRRFRSSGPRGMALAPKDRAGPLEALALPDAELYDLRYRVLCALDEHDRPAAEQALAAMRAVAPDHLLTLHARRSLASYDAKPAERLDAIEALLARYPEDDNLQLAKIACLRDLARRDERLALLRGLCARPGADPYYRQQYARELAADAREHDTAVRLLRQALRRQPTNAAHFSALADLLWDRRRFEESTELYRFAACLEDKRDPPARSYFLAVRYLKQNEAALLLLQDRFRRFGKQSGWPARTLAWAYGQLGRSPEALAVLDSALELRPDDGDLLLTAAGEYGRYGNFDRASALLVAAAGQAARAVWLRTAADLASWQGNPVAALGLWRQVLAAEPLALDAHRAVAQLLANTEGRAASVEHLRRACADFPHHFALHQLWAEWLRDDGPQAREPAVRRLIEIHPADGWSRRELALVLAAGGRLDEAFAELELAERLEPNHVSGHCVRGRLLVAAGKPDEAKAAYREALRLSADCEPALSGWIGACDSLAERRAALAFVEAELERQVLYGDGLLAYRQQAQNTLEAADLLAVLRRALQARPDLWHAWSAVIRELLEMSRQSGELLKPPPFPLNDEALDVARQATARFPLLASLWLDKARVCQARKDVEGEIEALRQAAQVNPGGGQAIRQLADAHQRAGRPDEAKALLQQAVAQAPLDAVNHGFLARLCWQAGEKVAALEHIRQALRLDPGYDWAWDSLRGWSGEAGRAEAAAFARELTTARGGDARCWVALARTLNGAEAGEERLAALDRALALKPRELEAADLRAELLAGQRRFDDALAACRPPVWGAQPPLLLRARAAWVEAQRGDRLAALEQMRAVVAEDANYYWAWRQLADWRREAGDSPGYLEAAGHLARLAPQSSTAWGYRGEAKVRAGDRAGGKEDLRRALALAPDYAFAAETLFDLQLADGELADAAQSLATLREGEENEFVLARAVQLAARRGDRDAAAAELRRLCGYDCEAPWPVDAAVAAMEKAGWGDAFDAAVRDALASPTVNARAAVKWARRWIDRPAPAGAKPDEAAVKAEREERLAALDRATRYRPRFVAAYDLKAEVLTGAKRHEEALAVCRPEAWGDAPPLPLRGRAAWVEAERGKKDEAIARMRALTAENPQYTWGWSRLAEWLRVGRQNAEYLEATGKWAEAAPRDETARGHLGEARLRAGDRAGAKEAFRKALELAPDYVYAGRELFDAHLADGEIDEAAATLERVKPHLAEESWLARAAQLAARRGEESAARQRLGELIPVLRTPALLDRAVAALDAAGWALAADDLLGKALDVPKAPAHAALLWVKRRTGRADWGCAERLQKMVVRGEAPVEALTAYARALGKARKRRELIRWVRTHRDVLRRSTQSWAQVGSALAGANDYREAVRWMGDWAERRDAQPWMLINQALHLRVLGRVEEATRVHRAALALRRDYTSDFHALWLALEDALGGNAAAAREGLARLEAASLDGYHGFLRVLAEAVLEVQEAGKEGRRRTFEAARRRLRDAVAAAPTVDEGDGMRPIYRRCVRRLAQDAGGLSAAAWGVWRRLRPVLPAVKKAD